MAPDRPSRESPPPATPAPAPPELVRLFHKLNNQLGIILANAELLEARLTDATHRARAGQVTGSAVEAIATAQELRRHVLPAAVDTKSQDASAE